MKTAEEILLNSKIGIKSDWNTEIWNNIIQAMHDYASSRSMESQWITVEERLPESEATILCLTKDGKQDVCEYIGRNLGEPQSFYLTEFSYFVEYTDVTHWMPLPQLPTK